MAETLQPDFANPARISVLTGIRASAAEVYAILCDIEHWPLWTTTVLSAERLNVAPLTVGSRVLIRRPGLKPAIWQVTAFDGRSFRWTTRSAGVVVTGGHAVTECSYGCEVRISLEFSGLLGPLVARFLRTLNERYILTEAEGLKRFCHRSESQQRMLL